MSKEDKNMDTTTTKTKLSALQSPEKESIFKRQKTFRQQETAKTGASAKSDQQVTMEEIKSALLPIQDALQDLTSQTQTFSETCNRILTRMEKAETRIAANEDNIALLTKRSESQEADIQMMQNKILDLEARSRRNNIIIRGIPESIQYNELNTSIIQIFETLLKDSVDVQQIVIERAHRAYRNSQASNTPRPVYVKILNFQDVNKILLTIKKSGGSIMWQSYKVSITQDLPAQIRQSRQMLAPYCKFLIDKNIRFQMKYPNSLIFTLDGIKYTVNTKKEARPTFLKLFKALPPSEN